jgi:predicted Fe-Mo cluster-binding NifX family protein
MDRIDKAFEKKKVTRMEYKIAAVTEDGEKLSSHFGRAPFYRIFSIDQGKVVACEQLAKPFHGEHAGHEHFHERAQHGHGHEDMFAPIRDCRVLLCGGMGGPAYQKAISAGLEVVLVGGDIESALQAYLKGDARSDLRRIHVH